MMDTVRPESTADHVIARALIHDMLVEIAMRPTPAQPFAETIGQATSDQLDEIERRCRAGEHPVTVLALSMVERERNERGFAATNAATCEGMKRGSDFARCTRPARYVVGDEYFGQTYRNDVLVRDAHIVELWGACHQHRHGFRARGSYGSAMDAWGRLDSRGSGCFNGRRLGSIELPIAD